MIRNAWITALLVLSLASFGACKEEGPMEKAGRQFDEAIEDMTDDDGPLETLGESLDDAVDAVEDFGEDLGDAVEDFGDKVSE